MQILKKQPPMLAQKLLGFFLPPIDKTNLLGDYEELFTDTLNEKGYFIAALWYWLQVMITIPQNIFDGTIWSLVMIRNYLKITLRNIYKYKSFTIINIMSLSISISLCLMIILFIKEEKSSDQFHKNKDSIYRVITTDTDIRWSEVKGWATTSGIISPALISNSPDVKGSARLSNFRGNVIYNETAFGLGGYYVEPSFLKMFSYPLLKGNIETALNEPYSIVISEATAKKYFGESDPLYQTLEIETYGSFKVTGVLKTAEKRSHIIFESLVSFSTINNLINAGKMQDILNRKDFNYIYTYLQAAEEADIERLGSFVSGLEAELYPEKEFDRYGFKLQALNDINLGTNLINPMPGTMHSFEIIFIPILAILVMIIACFNYVLLSIARSLKRTKEIGMRKVLGAKRKQIITLFLCETFVITFVSLIFAGLLLFILVPAFNGIDVIEYAKLQIKLDVLRDHTVYPVFLTLTLFITFIAGIYPALHLSSFKTVNALKGISMIKGSKRFTSRKILTATQFTVSIVTIVVIVFFYQQHIYLRNFDKGISIDNMVNVRLSDANYETFKNEMMGNSDILNISATSLIPIYGAWGATSIQLPNEKEKTEMPFMSVDENFIQNFGVNIIAGRNFSSDIKSDKESAAILNMTAVKLFGYRQALDAVGKSFKWRKKDYFIIGVLEDFIFRSVERPIDPLMLTTLPEYYSYANIKFNPGQKENVKSYLLKNWKKFDPLHALDARFYDDLAADKDIFFSDVILIGSWVTGFIIFIALLGLLGMTTYSNEIRQKEIGIRKVMGASAKKIVYILSKDYLKLILISGAVGGPLSYLIAELFLQFFPFRVELSFWVFPFALISVLGIALIMLVALTSKAATGNPVDVLREE